jgi:P-type Ca2+ transporter type 2C
VPHQSGGEVVRCLVRGAPDQLLGRATAVLGPGERPLWLDDETRARFLAETARLARQGLRVVATAWRDVDPRSLAHRDGDLLPLVDGLTLLALVGLADPPRPGSRQAVARANADGIRVRLLTGDRPIIGAGVARRLGIEGVTVPGADIASMADEEAVGAIDRIGVVARAAPAHKLRLVETLRGRDEVVAMTGDAVDDAPALAAAHVGIAAERAGADVDLPAIVRAVELGRRAQRDVIRSLRFALGAVAALLLTVVGGAVLHVAGGLAFLPLQALYVTFTTQVTQASALTADTTPGGAGGPPADGASEPLADRRAVARISATGLVQAAAVLAVIATAEARHGAATARTMGLVAFGLTTLLLSFAHRRAPVDRTFLLVSGASLAAIVLAAESATLNHILSTTALDLGQWLLCAGVAALAVVIASAIHGSLRRRPATADPNGGPPC